jgi:Cdc6-like AAA superfamily ATPase
MVLENSLKNKAELLTIESGITFVGVTPQQLLEIIRQRAGVSFVPAVYYP